MDLKELTAFRAVITEGTFSKAAAKLNYAQSTITHQVQRLEKELGFPLFKRGWEAELTPAGAAFAKEVDSLIAHWEYAADQGKALMREETGTIRLGAIESAAVSFLPSALQRFRELKPKLRVEIAAGNTETLSAALRRGDVDMAVCAGTGNSDEFYYEPLYKEEIVFIASKRHPLAERGELALEELFGHPFVVGGRTCMYYARLESELAKFAAVPFCYSVSLISAIPAYAARLSAVGVVLQSTPLPDDMLKLPVRLADPYIEVGIVRRRREEYLPTAKRLLIETVRELCGAAGDGER
ncbi:LysR substrate-binding domain-containing protein [Paenibacillus thailandensis]|uniref:LysR substrate-binding domain-containing protein n=1 Tax=Paenibacillus thailandensis TaxID=393250 RepID=A0ABW5QYJ7_9BACL